MPGQGSTTKLIAEKIESDNWIVVYKCIPNTPHLSVIPIPIKLGSSKQRYPDILAVKGSILRLIEVEISFTAAVTENIITRFSEMKQSLADKGLYGQWKAAVKSRTGITLPSDFTVYCELVICKGSINKQPLLVAQLSHYNITVESSEKYLT